MRQKGKITNVSQIKQVLPFTTEELYFLTERYVRYYWSTNKYYSVPWEYEVEDMIQLCFEAFLRRGMCEKYDPSITTKNYLVMLSVQRQFIDVVRKQQRHPNVISMETEIGEDLTLEDTFCDESVDVEQEVSDIFRREQGERRRRQIIDALPDTTSSKLRGWSSLLNREVNISYKTLALHLEAGWSIKQIANMYLNPRSGKPITTANVSQHVSNMRMFLLQTGVITLGGDD